MCQFCGNENLISKAKTQIKNTVNTIRKQNFIPSKLVHDVLHLQFYSSAFQ